MSVVKMGGTTNHEPNFPTSNEKYARQCGGE